MIVQKFCDIDVNRCYPVHFIFYFVLLCQNSYYFIQYIICIHHF